MLRLFLILFSIMTASVAHAETILVRSGEHTGFSRLVLDFDDLPDWSFVERDATYDLEILNQDIRFDTSSVFRKIPRKRIISVSDSRDGVLSLKVNCDCTVEAFEHRGRSIVLDVIDRTSDGAKRVVVRPAQHQPKPDIFPIVFDETADHKASPAPDTIKIIETLEYDRQRVSDAQAQLLRQLSEVFADGILQTDPQSTEKQIDEAVVIVEEIQSAEPNVRLSSSSEENDRVNPVLDDDQQCLSNDQINIASWGQSGQFTAGVATWRTKLVEEFDQTNQQGLKGLIRHYLYFGFGAEAIHLIENVGLISDDREALLAMAYLFEYGESPQNGFFQNMYLCENASALWAILEAPDNIKNANTAAVLREFNALPKHLRQVLGPRLSENMMYGGDLGSANLVLISATRAVGAETSALSLAEAKLDLKEGRIETAEASLQGLTSENTISAVDAFSTLIESKLARDEVISTADRTQLAAFAFEHKDTPKERFLISLSARAAAVSGDYQAAVENLSQIKDADISFRSLIMQDLMDNSSQTDFLKLAFSPPNELMPRQLNDQTRLLISSKLQDLGFEEQSKLWTGNPTSDKVDGVVAATQTREDEVTQMIAQVSDDQVSNRQSEANASIEANQAASTSIQSAQNDKVLLRNRNLLEQSNRVRQSLDAILSGDRSVN
ncbi:hypothetical protein [Pseudaestuariivita rosea]|uniref:hypothetical protein n=1 Tax=Pseudaestuariivita rosea TaxID=2763263 RepID=UPI001ABA63C8|nr:hypothetical protein [Pseudaestuariivita rosea]